MTPIAYISPDGVLFKELTPSPIFNATLIPLFTLEQLQSK